MRRAARQRRSYRQIFAGHVAQHDRAFVGGRLSEQALAEREALDRRAVGGQSIGGDAVELAAFAHEKCAGVDAEIVAQERQHALAELMGAGVAEHCRGQADATGLQPILQRAGRGGAQDQPGDGRGQREADDRRRHGARDRRAEGAVHLGEATVAHGDFGALHRLDGFAGSVHVLLAAAGGHDGEGRLGAARLAQADGLLELGQFVLDMPLQRDKAGALRGVVGDQRPDRVLVRDHLRGGDVVGPEILIVAGEQEPALSGFSVLQVRQQPIQRA